MSDQVFCYYCRRYHPSPEVRQVSYKGVKRWRCVKSLEQVRGSVAERDAFGKAVTAANRADKVWRQARPLPVAVIELLGGRRDYSEGLA